MNVTEEWERRFLGQSRFWVQRVLVPAIMAVGVAGNALTVAIMTRRRMRSSTTHLYLAALSTCDLLYLVLTFVLSLSHYPRVAAVGGYWRLRPLVLMFADASSNASAWLTVTFTVERWVAVCYPMRGQVLCTAARARRAVAAVALCCFAFALPTPFEWQVVEETEVETNRTVVRLEPSSLGRNDLYRTVYYWLTVVFFILLPLLLLAVFNSFLIRSVHLSRVQRRSLTGRGDDSRQENKITVMLIAVVILFLVCQLPTACLLLYSTLQRDADRHAHLLRGLGNIFNCLMALNAAGNFVLYCLLSHRYRQTFLLLFCGCVRAPPPPLSRADSPCSSSRPDAPTSGARAAGVCDRLRKMARSPWRRQSEKTTQAIPLRGGVIVCDSEGQLNPGSPV